MRIKSTFRDFYDCIQSQEKSILFVRESKEIPKEEIINNLPKFEIVHQELHFTTFIIGFCGKIYPSICHHINQSGPLDYNISSRDRLFFYSEEEFTSYIIKKLTPIGHSRYIKQKLKDITWNRSIWGQKNIKRAFEDIKKEENNYGEIFLKYKYPIFIYQNVYNCNGYTYNQYFTLNGILQNVEFFKVFQPFQAFQELEMYLGNQASPEKPIPKIDDVTMAHAKGFDKYSFRKDKSKRKKL